MEDIAGVSELSRYYINNSETIKLHRIARGLDVSKIYAPFFLTIGGT